MNPRRVQAILVSRSKWVNGTELHYHFLEGPELQRQAVREAFGVWKALGIGLEFAEESDASEAEVRIGFDQSDGSWSYLGRDVLDIAVQERTMNFGWDLTDAEGASTALHEIGHTLGMPHEHQNPKAGIVWDEEAVYAELGGSPNFWDRQTTFNNILRKLDLAEVEGSDWDPDSVMHYPFDAGLILEPESARDGITPPGTISAMDQQQVRRWYPTLAPAGPATLRPFSSQQLPLPPGQAEYLIAPEESRDYKIGTFGDSDAVVVLFEKVDGAWRFRQGDDDSAEERNAMLEAKLHKGREYLVRVRVNHAWGSGNTALMYW